MIQSILGENDFKTTVLQSKSPIIVDFWAKWCAPCLAAGPVLEELAKEYIGKIDFAKVDVDANGPLAAKYGVTSIPTMLIFEGGQPVRQITGFKPRQELKKALDGILEG
ncbi:MAG: thioredoxin [Chloroflexi bacterium]|nr:thioredoxin [Chloroflexota bacterium]